MKNFRIGSCRHIGALMLFLALVLSSAPVRAQISPGPLSAPHASLSGPTQCSSCHKVGLGTAALKCQECHTEIAQELTQTKGLHGKFANNEQCAQCHSEHNGRDFPLIHWVPSEKDFDHNQTGYPLQGKHAGLTCNQCHSAAHVVGPNRGLIKMQDLNRTFLGLSEDCGSCHEDVHKGQLGQNCLQCHNFVDWKGAKNFDHSKSRYPLSGDHAHVACEKCHTAAEPGGEPRFRGIPFKSCTDCHADIHHGAFAKPCEICHTTNGWKQAGKESQFDHSKTKYPLLGKHAQVDCLKCHDGGNFKRPVAFVKCTDCHTTDPHGGQFAGRKEQGECAECHTVQGWKPSLFDVKMHASTRYRLDGKHAGVPCDKCHVPAGTATRYKIRFAKCQDCHKDTHEGQFAGPPYGNRCEKCHTLAGFKPSTYTIAQHQSTRFPLREAHLAVPCEECHQAAKGSKSIPYRFADRACTACHADPHHGEFTDKMSQKGPSGAPAGCQACHTVKSWTDLPKFDHSKTKFPLLGAHGKVPCDECHKPEQGDKALTEAIFRSTPTACASCHLDVHAGQFTKEGRSGACDQCHNTDKWSPSLFDHERQTDFSLRGAHEKVPCKDCHTGYRLVAGKRVLFYKLTPRLCADCHD